jgi:hypothetical protein
MRFATTAFGPNRLNLSAPGFVSSRTGVSFLHLVYYIIDTVDVYNKNDKMKKKAKNHRF